MASSAKHSFVPGLGFGALTRFYDACVALSLKEEKMRGLFLDRVAIAKDARVLDLGSGTGSLLLLANRRGPSADLTGIDPDPAMIAIATKKAAEAAAPIRFEQGRADALPFPDESFDRVVTSLVLHHLTREEKRAALREALRVLRPGGEIHIADWGEARSPVARVFGFVIGLLDGADRVADNYAGRLPSFLSEVGFDDVRETHQEMTLLGPLSLYQGRKPG